MFANHPINISSLNETTNNNNSSEQNSTYSNNTEPIKNITLNDDDESSLSQFDLNDSNNTKWSLQ